MLLNSSSLLSSNFAMTGQDLGALVPGAVWVATGDLAELEAIQTVPHFLMLYMAHLRAGLWVLASVSIFLSLIKILLFSYKIYEPWSSICSSSRSKPRE